MKNITYRYLKMSDLDQLLTFVNTLSKEQTYIRLQGKQIKKSDEKKYLENRIKDIKNKKVIHILAFDKNQIIGAADVKVGYGAEKHVATFGVMVKKEYRNKGIGTTLIKKALKDAVEKINGLEIITLGVFGGNDKALHLYEKFGFKKHGSLPNGIIRKNKYYNHIYMHLNIKNK